MRHARAKRHTSENSIPEPHATIIFLARKRGKISRFICDVSTFAYVPIGNDIALARGTFPEYLRSRQRTWTLESERRQPR